MSASAMPVEEVFKSLLAVVLAISLCPLVSADKAQAEEAGESSESTDAVQVADEGEGEETDFAEDILETGNSNADPELTEENNSVEDEDVTDDNNVALQAASDSGTPIVDWTECGTCQWRIDSKKVSDHRTSIGGVGRTRGLDGFQSALAQIRKFDYLSDNREDRYCKNHFGGILLLL